MRNFIYKGEGSAQPRQVKRNGSEKAAAPKDSNAKK
jgi:hypothetical protein